MGPDDLGDEFDEVGEDEWTDQDTVYDTLAATEEHGLTIVSRTSDELTIEVDGDDVFITINIVGDKDREGTKCHLVVPRSALAESLSTIGLIRG